MPMMFSASVKLAWFSWKSRPEDPFMMERILNRRYTAFARYTRYRNRKNRVTTRMILEKDRWIYPVTFRNGYL